MTRRDLAWSSARRRVAIFLRQTGGNSAVEFALLSPVLAFLLIGLADVGQYAYQRTDMFGAARAGAQYFMAGGGNLSTAHSVVTASWSRAPADATVNVDRYCLCGGSEYTCNSPCADGEPPAAFRRIEISATYRGLLMDLPNSATEIVRVR